MRRSIFFNTNLATLLLVSAGYIHAPSAQAQLIDCGGEGNAHVVLSRKCSMPTGRDFVTAV